MSPPPPIALEAATVILARDRLPLRSGIEVLLIRRPSRSRVAGGNYVFPGGRIEEEDWGPGIAALCRGLSRDEAAARLRTVEPPERAIGFWVAAIREVFEEIGVLLAYDRSGNIVRLQGEASERIRRLRQACRERAMRFADLLHAEGLRLAADRLQYFSHWITPEERSVRNNARFFVAPAPADQEIVLEPSEATAFQWVRPHEAVVAEARGVLPMRFPTIKTLEALAGYGEVTDLIAEARAKVIKAIRPRVVGERIVLPGEPGYY